MRELGSCFGTISSEHIISEAVIKILASGGDFQVSGYPWLKPGETKKISPKSLTAKCLCRRHNSMLEPLDSAAKYFFSSLKSYFEIDGDCRHAVVSGHDLERWLLKTAKAMAVSRNFASAGDRLTGIFNNDNEIVDLLDDPKNWAPGSGLYCLMDTGDTMVNHRRLQVLPFTNHRGEIEALVFSILGLEFLLFPDAPDFSRHSRLKEAKYRPSRIVISQPRSTNWVTLSWEDDLPHEPLVLTFQKKWSSD